MIVQFALKDTTQPSVSAEFVRHKPYLSPEEMTHFLPVDLMATLPQGGLASVIVLCRVTEVLAKERERYNVNVYISSHHWSDETALYVRSMLLQAIERAFAACVRAGMAPVQGSEVELVAYYAKNVELSMEDFTKNFGVIVSVRADFNAGKRRDRERQLRLAASRAEKTRPLWRRILDAFFPPIPVPAAPSVPVIDDPDRWGEEAETFSATFLGACEQSMGSLLRRVTIRDPQISAYLLGQGVVLGESLTMAAARGELFTVTRVQPTGMYKARSIFTEDGEVDDLDPAPPRGVASPDQYETRFTPKNR